MGDYCNLPQGHMAAGDAYTACYDEITQGFECMEQLVDNIRRVCQYITKCSRAGITFNKEKF